MKKRSLIQLIAAFNMLFLPCTLHAEEPLEVQFLVVTQTNGTVSKFALTEAPVITYDGNDVVITCSEKTLQTSMDGVKNCTFVTETISNGIEDVRQGQTKTTFAFGKALFEGLQSGARVLVYTIDGKAVSSVSADGDGCASIDLNALSGGVYILRTPDKSFKIKK